MLKLARDISCFLAAVTISVVLGMWISGYYEWSMNNDRVRSRVDQSDHGRL